MQSSLLFSCIVQSCVVSKALPSKEEPDISSSIMGSKAYLHLLNVPLMWVLLAKFLLGAG